MAESLLSQISRVEDKLRTLKELQEYTIYHKDYLEIESQLKGIKSILKLYHEKFSAEQEEKAIAVLRSINKLRRLFVELHQDHPNLRKYQSE